MSKINNFVSIDEIISGVYRYRGNSTTVINKSDLIDWVKLFLDKINYPYQYKKVAVKSKAFKDYRYKLPSGFKELEFVCINGIVAKNSRHSSLVSETCNNTPVPAYLNSTTGNIKNIVPITYEINDYYITPSVETGTITIVCKCIVTDSDGIPMVPDTELYKNALIWFLVEKYDYSDWRTATITDKVYAKTEQEYAWAVGQLTNYLKIPNEEEMKRLQRIFTRFVIPDNFESAAADCEIEVCTQCNADQSTCACTSSTIENIYDGSGDVVVVVDPFTPNEDDLFRVGGFQIFDKWNSPIESYTNPLGDDYINCITISRYWEDLNPDIGVYDFTDLNTDIEDTITAGKKFAIKIAAGNRSPDWIYANGVTELTFNEYRRQTIPVTYSVPIFWSNEYKGFYKDFIEALRTNLTPYMSDLKYLSASGINRETAEFAIPFQKTTTVDSPSIWVANGYTTQLHIDTATELMDYIIGQFPDTPLALPMISTMKLNNDSINELYMDYLSTKGNQIYIVDTYLDPNYDGTIMTEYAKSKNIKIGGQLAEVFYESGTKSKTEIDALVKAFHNYGGSFLEIYTNNVLLQSAIFRPLSSLFI